MAIAVRFAVKKTGSAASSIQTDAGSNSVTGDTLIVAISDPVSGNITAPTDTISGSASGNTWAQVGTDLAVGSTVMRMWRCDNANGGSDHRVTVAPTSGAMDAALYFIAISDAATSSFDATAQNTDGTSPFGDNVSTGTLAQAAEIIVAFFGSNSSPGTISEGTGFTIQVKEENDALFWTSALATKVVSSTSSVSCGFTVSGSAGTPGVILASFRETVSGGGGSLVVPAPHAQRNRRTSGRFL